MELVATGSEMANYLDYNLWETDGGLELTYGSYSDDRALILHAGRPGK